MVKHTAVRDFEQQLFDHVELLYAVALKLTQSPADAQRVTRTTVLQAWHWRERLNNGCSLKAELLKLLRQTFINLHRVCEMREALYNLQQYPLRVREGGRATLPCSEDRAATRFEVATVP